MTTRRVIIGKRSNGDNGIFVSPAGVDAFTAADSQLLLNIQSKVSQLILLGRVSSSQTVALGLNRSPVVLCTSRNTLAGVPGHSGSGGPTRPSPLNGSFPTSSATINGNGASMTINCSVDTVYAVYGLAFT